MPITTIIVDDEKPAREELTFLLKAFPEINLIAQGRNGLEAVALIKEHSPDLVFLDVQMPGLDGFGVIKKLLDRKLRPPQIVFATAFDTYAVQAFEVNAVDYILKPFDKGRVARAIQRAKKQLDAQASPVERLETLITQMSGPPGSAPAAGLGAAAASGRQTTKLLLRAQQRMLLVDSGDLIYATISDGCITMATRDIEGTSNYRTIEELQAQLDPELFWRVHRSWLVNINHIKEVVPWFKSSYVLRMNGKKQIEIPVSRTQSRRLRELLKL
jgi:two-component system response regulator LytT